MTGTEAARSRIDRFDFVTIAQIASRRRQRVVQNRGRDLVDGHLIVR